MSINGIDTATREIVSDKKREGKHPSFSLPSAHNLSGISHGSNLARNQPTGDTGKTAFPYQSRCRTEQSRKGASNTLLSASQELT